MAVSTITHQAISGKAADYSARHFRPHPARAVAYAMKGYMDRWSNTLPLARPLARQIGREASDSRAQRTKYRSGGHSHPPTHVHVTGHGLHRSRSPRRIGSRPGAPTGHSSEPRAAGHSSTQRYPRQYSPLQRWHSQREDRRQDTNAAIPVIQWNLLIIRMAAELILFVGPLLALHLR